METFDPEKIVEAEDLVGRFSERANEVTRILYSDLYCIRSHGSSCISVDGTTVIHFYWDGYDAEPFDNCSLSFPFDYVNMTNEELEALKPKVRAEVEEERRLAEEERERRQKEEVERKEREQYERLKEKFG